MIMAAKLNNLRQKIESVTTEMTASAELEDWGRAGELGDLRQNLLEALFAATEDPAEERGLIERILESDQQLRVMAEKNRNQVSDELAIRRERREAVGVYRDAASAAT